MNSSVRNFLRAQAHDVHPIVMVGKGGYDEMVAKALDEALLHHELVKVKFQANRDQMEQIASQLAVATNSELVGKIGFISIFYRESEEHLITMPRALFK